MSKDPSTLLLEHHLKALKRPTILRDYTSVAAAGSQERVSYPQSRLRLTERELLDRERRVRLFTTMGLVTQMLEQREARSRQRFLRQLERLDRLILHELGYVPFVKPGAERLFDVVGRAEERASLIVTTNLPFEQWTEVLGSDRLTHPGAHPRSQRSQLPVAGRQSTTQTPLNLIAVPGARPGSFPARNILPRTCPSHPPKPSSAPTGAALLDRHPPHFSGYT